MKEESAIVAESGSLVRHLEFNIQNSTSPPSPAELDRPQDRRGMVFLIGSAVLAVLVAAASWAPDSRMTELRWLPEWIARLADRDPNIRTAVPFIPLAFFLMRGFARCGLKWPVVVSVLVCGLCLGLAELGQVFLPCRTADIADLLWGGAGIVLGTVLAGLWHLLLRQARAADKVGPGDAAEGAAGGGA